VGRIEVVVGVGVALGLVGVGVALVAVGVGVALVGVGVVLVAVGVGVAVVVVGVAVAEVDPDTEHTGKITISVTRLLSVTQVAPVAVAMEDNAINTSPASLTAR
jgi:hypothetical protein